MLDVIQLQQQLQVSNQAIIWNRRLICNKQWLYKNIIIEQLSFYFVLTYSICLVFSSDILFFVSLKEKIRIDFRQARNGLFIYRNA
jgi:hypothetical protein